jgi:hypothetical protein
LQVRLAVKTVLRREKVRPEDFEPFTALIWAQARALYVDWLVSETQA